MKRATISVLFSALFIWAALSLPVIAEAGDYDTYDVAVVGGGSGGCAAALQAARMGMSVVILEETDWLGGQMTAAAVSTMDDKTFTRTGIYGEFIDNVKLEYLKWKKEVNVCYWGSDTVAFEPGIGQDILLRMLRDTHLIKIYYKAKPVSAKVSKHNVTSAVFDIGGSKMTINAKVFIDATECGDFIPLTGARYRAGNSISPKFDKSAIIQDITYVAVVKQYRKGLPEELKMKSMPPHYTDYIEEFRKVVAKSGDKWPGNYPFNIPSFLEYRALPDNSVRDNVDGGKPETWGKVTKTGLNWANDYPGKDADGNHLNMSVLYLLNPKYRLMSDRKAMEKTLAFVYYMQKELGLEDWSVDNEAGYTGFSVSDWKEWPEMPEEFAPVLSCFPPRPYVRESRRLVGVKTMTVKDILRVPELFRTEHSAADAAALGEYPVDLHGIHDTEYLDRDLGETENSIPNDWQGKGGLFQIPLGVLIPEKIDGLLAAEKNISVSRVVNGSTRLQPVTMLTGQAAGALAALSISEKVQPRKVRAFDVQMALLAAHDKLSIYRLNDVEVSSPYWPAVELVTVYGYIDPLDERTFGVSDTLHWVDVKSAMRRVEPKRTDFPSCDLEAEVGSSDLALWLSKMYGKKRTEKYKPLIDKLTEGGSAVLTKGDLASAVFEIVKADNAHSGKASKRK